MTGLFVSLPIWLFDLSHRMMRFLSILYMVFALLTTTLHLSLKLSYWLFPLGVACGSCYCRRCIVLVVGTLVPRRLPMLYCHVYGGLVCLEMGMLLFKVVPIASTQAPVDLLHPVGIACERSEVWLMGFITDLPPYGGFSGLYTCIDKLTNFVKLILISIGQGALSAPEVACLFFEHVVQLFGNPCVILHDLDAHFTAHFWSLFVGIIGGLSLNYLQSTILSQLGRPKVLIRQWNRLSSVLWLSGGSLRIIGMNSLAQSNWLSIQLFRILQLFHPVNWFLAKSCILTLILWWVQLAMCQLHRILLSSRVN